MTNKTDNLYNEHRDNKGGKSMKNRLKNFLQSEKWEVLWKYSVLFFILSLFMVFEFFKYRKGFMYTGDGITQHYVTLGYFREFLLNFFKTGHLNTFTWNILLGIDMFPNLAYYSFGDFVSYLSVLFPKEYIHYAYYLFLFIRMYFIGIGFIIYAKYKKISNFYSIIGALAYSFCLYTLIGATLHPYFMNAIAIFPLLMYAIEKIVIEDKKTVFISTIFLTFLTSFYFGYMMSLCIAIYGSILIITTYKKEGIKKIFHKFIQVFLCALLGIAMTSIVLLPTLTQFFQSGRSLNGIKYTYNLEYYRRLITAPISTIHINWLRFSVNSFALAIFPLALKNFKKYKNYLLFLAFLFIPLLFPSIGSMFCCFSFPLHRWSYVLSFLIIFLAIQILNDKESLKKEDIVFLLGFYAIYLLLFLLTGYSLSHYAFFTVCVVIIQLYIISNKKTIEEKFKKIGGFTTIFTFVFLFSVCGTVYYLFDVTGESRISSFAGLKFPTTYYNTSNKTIKNFDEAIAYLKKNDKDFYRISKTPAATYNAGLYYNYNSINGYYSIMPKLTDFLGYDLSNREAETNTPFREFDSRSSILSLLSSKYYIADKDVNIPYGYEKIKSFGKTTIYENKYFVPFMAYYDTYMNINDYEKLSNIDKEQALLQMVALDKNSQSLKTSKSVIKDYKKLKFNNPLASKKKIEVKNSKNNTYTITLDKNELTSSNIYLRVKNIYKVPYTKKQLIDLKTKNTSSFVAKNKIKNKYRFYIPDTGFTFSVKYGKNKITKTYHDTQKDPYDSGNRDLIINISNLNENNKIEITFPNLGVYTFDGIEVYEQKYEHLKKHVSNLSKTNFKLMKLDSGYLKGSINLEKAGFVQMSTTYSKGLSVYVDGTKVKTEKANKYFIGFYAKEGKHVVEVKYKTPYLNVSFIVSLVALGVFIFVCKKEKSKVKK